MKFYECWAKIASNFINLLNISQELVKSEAVAKVCWGQCVCGVANRWFIWRKMATNEKVRSSCHWSWPHWLHKSSAVVFGLPKRNDLQLIEILALFNLPRPIFSETKSCSRPKPSTAVNPNDNRNSLKPQASSILFESCELLHQHYRYSISSTSFTCLHRF